MHGGTGRHGDGSMNGENTTMVKSPATAPVTYTLRFPDLDREIQSRDGESVFLAARRNGVRIVGACGGRGSCGACMVRVTEGTVGAYGTETLVADCGAEIGGSFGKWVRCCGITPQSACTIEIAPRSLAPVVRAEVDYAGAAEVLPFDPAVRTCGVTVPEATLIDNASDLDRVLLAAGERVD